MPPVVVLNPAEARLLSRLDGSGDDGRGPFLDVGYRGRCESSMKE
jgi:hypothetical protein